MPDDHPSQPPARCPRCGMALTEAGCTRCALALAGEEMGFDDEELHLLFPELDIVGKIARGGFGTVYRAEHRKLKRPVALKFLDPDIAVSEEGVSRFEEEMAAVGKLDHPGIVRAHDAGEREGHWYIVMEFVDGENLATLSRRTGPMPPAEACHIIRQAALALGYAHERGLVHRDVKPGNIMVATGVEGGKMVALSPVKVLDFGLAASAKKRDDSFSGSPDYAAPEQITTPRDVDARADIFGLGATLFRLLTGVPPRSAGGDDSISSRIQRIASTPSPPVASLRQDLPAGLAALCDRMLSMNRDERPATAKEVAELLAPFAGVPKPRKRWWPLAAAALIAALLTWLLIPAREPVKPPRPDTQSALIKRRFKDIGEGLFFFNGTPIGIPGTVTEWSFYDDKGGPGSVTPVLFTRIGDQHFVIQGIGTSRRSKGTGVQTFPFGLLVGSDTVGPNTCFGFADRLIDKGKEVGTVVYKTANPGVVDGEDGGPWLFVHGGRLTAGPPMRVGLEFAVIEGNWVDAAKPVPVNVGRTYSARAIVTDTPAPGPVPPTTPLQFPDDSTMDDDKPPLRDQKPVARNVAPLQPGLVVIDDEFDDGVLGTNVKGKGDGFWDAGRVSPTESNGFLNLDRANLDNEMTYVSARENAVYPFEAEATSITWKFGTILRSPGRQRMWVGWRKAKTLDDRFFGGSLLPDAVNVPAKGLYVSIISQYRSKDGYATRGNLVATDETGTITQLATWKWADPDKLSGLVVKLTTTKDRYRLDFSGAEGGIPVFVTGGPEGAITGMGHIEKDTIYDFGGMNQFPDAKVGETKLDRLTVEKNVPFP